MGAQAQHLTHGIERNHFPASEDRSRGSGAAPEVEHSPHREVGDRLTAPRLITARRQQGVEQVVATGNSPEDGVAFLAHALANRREAEQGHKRLRHSDRRFGVLKVLQDGEDHPANCYGRAVQGVNDLVSSVRTRTFSRLAW